MIYSHSPLLRRDSILGRIAAELLTAHATAPFVELVEMAPPAELQARAAAERKNAEEYRRRRHALRMRG